MGGEGTYLATVSARFCPPLQVLGSLRIDTFQLCLPYRHRFVFPPRRHNYVVMDKDLLTPLDYAMIIHSVVGFKPKKFDLVHQIVFLVRGVVWVQD